MCMCLGSERVFECWGTYSAFLVCALAFVNVNPTECSLLLLCLEDWGHWALNNQGAQRMGA
jgi:hypothetical protein